MVKHVKAHRCPDYMLIPQKHRKMQPTHRMHDYTRVPHALLPIQQLCSWLFHNLSLMPFLSKPFMPPSTPVEKSDTNSLWALYKPLLVTSQETSKSNKSCTGRSSSSHWGSPLREVMDSDLASGIFFSPQTLTTQATTVSKCPVNVALLCSSG